MLTWGWIWRHSKWNKPVTKKTNTIWLQYEVPSVVEFIQIECRMGAGQGLGGGIHGNFCLMDKVSALQDEKSPGDGCGWWQYSNVYT